MTGINDASDPYETELFFRFTDNEVAEIGVA